MKLVFLCGFVLATYLTLNYPETMRGAYNKAVEYVNSGMTYINSK